MHVKIFVKIVKILLIDSLFLFIIFSRDIKKEEKRIMMKKWGFILLAFILWIGVMPKPSSAAQQASFEKELNQYLEEVSKQRGFKVTREHIEFSLAQYEEKIENFDSVEELRDFLGEVIQKDLSNLTEIYDEFNLNEASLRQLLQEHGEDLDEYVFVENLYDAVMLYIERDPNFDKNLQDYLAKISSIRGFPVTIDYINRSLSLYERKLEDFKTVKSLERFLGEVIKKDLSNLSYIYDEYDLNEKELRQLLQEHGKKLEDYVFLDDLEEDVITFLSEEWDAGVEDELLYDLLTVFEQEYGLTKEEIERLKNHLRSIEEHLMKEETIIALLDLADRMMAFEGFDEATELTKSQIEELISIFKDFQRIFKIKVTFSLVKDGSEKELSLFDLFNLKELINAKLKINIYSESGEFLADLLITGEIVDSDTLHRTGQTIRHGAQEAKNVKQEKNVSQKIEKKLKAVKDNEHKTVKGAKLPKTDSGYGMNAMVGLFIVLAGFLIFRQARKV